MLNPAREQVHISQNFGSLFYCDNVNTGVSRIMIFTP